MEQFLSVLKTRLKDPAYDFRQDSFLNFLKTPRRAFKESPMVKDYVDLTEKNLETMATSIYGKISLDQIKSDATILLGNGKIVRTGKVSGVEIQNITESLEGIPEILWEKEGKDREEFLINASWNSGYYITVKQDVEATIDIDAYTSASESGTEKNVVFVGKFAKVKLRESRYTLGESKEEPTQGKALYIFLDEGSTLEYNYLQDKHLNVNDITFVRTYQKKGSTFKIFHVNHGAGKLLFVNESTQEESEADYRVFGASFSNESQAIDIRDSSFQLGKSTSADIQVRGVVSGKSSTIHRGNIDIELPSINSTGFYDSKILLLSKDGYANSKPGLVIRNNNTRSKHGSAISSVDKEQMLYLESRGIEEKMATTLITGGFIGSIIEKSKNEKFIETVKKYAQDLNF
jgi:Fe-S cluster assembly protein SufD